MAAIGEVGLSGEIRAVPQLERRLAEVARMGFKKCLVPRSGLRNVRAEGIELVPVSTLREAVRLGLVGKEKPQEDPNADSE
jgi:DNA repair protein RadA/Sms